MKDLPELMKTLLGWGDETLRPLLVGQAKVSGLMHMLRDG